MKPRSFHDTSRGNVLFIILIAIALLAALTFSMTRSSRTTSNVSAEDAEIAAQSILSYTNSVMEATERVMASNGCRDEEVSFENAVVAGYTNAAAPADGHCNVFSQQGGGAKWEEMTAKWLDAAFSANALYGNPFIPAGDTCVDAAGTGNAASGCTVDNNDVYLVMPFLDLAVCQTINKKLRINLPTGSPPVDTGNAWPGVNAKFTGSFAATAEMLSPAGNAGRLAACFEGGGSPPSGSYHFYQVLIAR